MAIENITDLGDVVGVVSQPVVQGLDFLVKVGIGVGIAIIIYVLYLLFKGFFQMRRAQDIRKVLRVLERIDDKMDVLVKDKRKKKGKK